jgi:hypothetical protein
MATAWTEEKAMTAVTAHVHRKKSGKWRRRDTTQKIGLDISDAMLLGWDAKNARRPVLMEPTAGRRSARDLPPGALEQPNARMDVTSATAR